MEETRKSLQTRARILDSAQRLFVEQGFIQTQMTDIAKEIGIGRKTLYRYYADKSELGYAVLKAVFVRIDAHLNHYLDTHRPSSDTHLGDLVIDALLDTYHGPVLQAEMRFMGEFDAYYSGNRIPSDFIERVTELGQPETFSRLFTLMSQAQAQGQVTQQITPEMLVSTLHHSLKNLCQQSALRESAFINLTPNQNQHPMPTVVELLRRSLRP